MPLYDYRCPKCGLEFEVSRPISRATEPALCPFDKSESERVFTMPMTFTRGAAPEESSAPAEPSGGSWSHFGHSHGHGAGAHSHGPGGAP
jgi:putative FmdB family regulatory protein